MFKTILTATDGSDHATKAVEIASDLAVKNGAGLVIAHVISEDEAREHLRRFAETEQISNRETPQAVQALIKTPHGSVAVPGGEQSVPDLLAARREIGQMVLRDAKALAQNRGAGSVDCLLLKGEVAEQILCRARDRNVDAIVLGSRGIGRLKSAIVSSVSQQVCDQADCTCITVN